MPKAKAEEFDLLEWLLDQHSTFPSSSIVSPGLFFGRTSSTGAMSNSEAYSTLEVRNYSQLPEVVDPEQYQKEIAGPQPPPGQAHYANGALNPYPPAEGYYGHGVPVGAAGGVQSPASPYDGASMASYQGSPGLYDANNAKMPYVQNGQAAPPVAGAEEKKPKRTICGVAPLIFYIILAAIFAVIVAAVVGGVVGSIASRNKGDEDAAQSSAQSTDGDSGTNSTAPLILSDSRLTATNWTDPDGVTHRAVFFQDAYDDLVVCQWDSKDKTWAKTNITELLSPSTSPISAVSGTPLASAAIDDQGNSAFEIHLWFLNSTSFIQSVSCLDATSSKSWKTDTLGGAALETRPGSLLAATWQRGWADDQLGSWIVAYQRPSDGAIKTANSSHWTVSDEAVPGDTVVNNSSLALIPQRVGDFLDGVELITQGLGDSTTGSMQLSSYDAGWDLNQRDILASNVPAPSKTQHFAATSWDNWSNYLYLALLNGGSMVGNHFDGNTFTTISDISFSGGPAQNFTAIAMTDDAMFYAISNDEILEYSIDTSNPSNLIFVGTVFSASNSTS
ncbi:hypothetical protein SLS62_011423 [Diatrype stigma]|uniref:Fucose-specific lectin n=1 Tax=Diatrype stigma TaxID=117547 RepID=A0AAN9U564_9PEZI